MRIPRTTLFAALAIVILNSCAERDPVTLPEIDTSASASGIVALPDLQEIRDGTDLLREIELLRFSDSLMQLRPDDPEDR